MLRQHRELSAVSGFFDLNFFQPVSVLWGGARGRLASLTMGDECWSNRLRPGDGAFSDLRVSKMRRSLRRRFSKAQLFLLGSVSLSRLRATDVSRKLARYRSVPPFCARETLSHGLSRPHLALHAIGRQRVHRLAHLRRLRTSVDRDRKSRRLNSSHQIISYAVFCLKKK